MQMLTALTALIAALPPCLADWPDLPFTVSGRDILSASGAKVVYAGVNWPGAADTMLPEGLQYNSIANIVGFVKSLGMNVVRLTYAIEMIDDYLGDSPNQSLQVTLTNALGDSNGTTVLQEILKYNPQFAAQTTRLEVRGDLVESMPMLMCSFRSSTRLLQNWLSSRFGSILTIMSPKQSGAVGATMAMHGLEVSLFRSPQRAVH